MTDMWDTNLFLWLNFDGGAAIDRLMLVASGKLTWIPIYILIIWLIATQEGTKEDTNDSENKSVSKSWRESINWRGATLALALIGAAVGIADLISGIFKKTGPLKHLWSAFPARLRPMHTPELEGLIHVISRGAAYGTVSAHAATATAIAIFATLAIRKRWFTVVMWTQCMLVCYSRIYLSYHFPQDILLGIAVGLMSGAAMWMLFERLKRIC